MRKGLKRILGCLLAAGTVFSAAGAEEAPDYVMEGYDGGSASHDWETNLFFQRMQEDSAEGMEAYIQSASSR
jgi:hypothetical protein